nr:uncharacterized protein LOC106732104 [Pelodiscus sinensis]|eukprot:XP_014429700.1 uncharacterized protein LOC106732104 [Pelodiscus sinensis]
MGPPAPQIVRPRRTHAGKPESMARFAPLSSLAPPWPESDYSSDLDASSIRSGSSRTSSTHRSRSRHRRDHTPQTWPPHPQWPFWIPWAYHQWQGQLPPSLGSGTSGHRSQPSACLSQAPPSPLWAPQPDPAALQLLALEVDPSGAQATQTAPHLATTVPVPLQESLSSSPDEALADPAQSLPSMDARMHQDLLRRMAANLVVPVELVIEDTDPVVDILTEDAPTRLALPLNKTVSLCVGGHGSTSREFPRMCSIQFRTCFLRAKLCSRSTLTIGSIP